MNTEFHGKDRSRKLATERRHIFQSRMRERRFFLARANTTFIAYLYKPEAQAKVLQIPVYYSHIIPSLALQACKARNTVKSRFPHPPLIVDKGARTLRQAQGPGFCTVSELAELAVKLRDREILAVCLHLP